MYLTLFVIREKNIGLLLVIYSFFLLDLTNKLSTNLEPSDNCTR